MTRAVLLTLYTSFFAVLAYIDFKHRIVPNKLVLPALIVAPFAAYLWGHSPMSIAVGGAVHFGVFALSAAVMRGAIGMGDVKLAIVLGMLTGFPGVFVSMMAAAVLSGVISLGLVVTRTRSLKDYIPFAPFMLGGALVALLWPQP